MVTIRQDQRTVCNSMEVWNHHSPVTSGKSGRCQSARFSSGYCFKNEYGQHIVSCCGNGPTIISALFAAGIWKRLTTYSSSARCLA
jgi:hypothetical protein